MNRDPLIIWREVMPDVEKGVFSYISENWNNKVKCYYIHHPLSERLDSGWDQHSYSRVQVEGIPEDVKPNEFMMKIIAENPDAILVFFGGLRHKLKKYLDSYLNQVANKKIVIIAEKPLITSKLGFLRKISKKILYRSIIKKYESRIDVFLAMGIKGVDRYKEYGYSKKSIYPFMYNPIMNIDESNTSFDGITVNNPKKFLYLGRFDYQFKGCDVLMKAFDNIDPELEGKWELTVAGGYGKQKNEIIQWAKKNEHVDFGGTWKQNDIIKKMSQYDVCLVPSKEDGWNLTPNYAIYSHIGTITSDEATSHELIQNSGAGIVYKSKDILELKKNIELAIKNRDVVMQWKQNTFAYKENISPEAVGNYFIDIIDYTFYGSLKKPVCPWFINQ